MAAHYTVTIDNHEYDIVLDYHADHLAARVNDRSRHVQVHALQDTRALLLIDGESHEVDIHSIGPSGETVIFMQGMEIPVTVEDYNLAQMRKTAGITTAGTVFPRPDAGTGGRSADRAGADGQGWATAGCH
jgi:hypothetical protein